MEAPYILILILGYTTPAKARELRKYDLTQTLIDYEYSLLLNEQGYDVKTHIKVDTGIHRLGFDTEGIENISAVFSMKLGYIPVCVQQTALKKKTSALQICRLRASIIC